MLRPSPGGKAAEPNGNDMNAERSEKNKARIKEMEIVYADKTFEVASMSRRSEVEKRLRAMDSKVQEPEKQAITIE